MIIHVVKTGDSIYSIASRYNVTPEQLITQNELTNSGQLVVGQTIVVLNDSRVHRVAAGETLFTIARTYGIDEQEILAVNPQLRGSTQVVVGQVLYIPRRSATFGTIDVNGYTLPTSDIDVIRRTLPSLTFLSIFSYEVNPNGTLRAPNDTPFIEAARAARVGPIMVITNLEAGGGFSSNVAKAILRNNQVQDTLINNVLEVMRTKRYYGLDIDFEYVFPEDREFYNDFLRKVVSRLHNAGYIVVTSLAPKTSATQQGLLYEAHDYPVHGALVDHVVPMTYEWGYTYGPPLAVAPLPEVRKVLNYAVSAIPRQKILMGIPNYGYDWTLPYVQGSSARTLSNVGAVDQARRVKAAIQYDPVSRAPFYTYYDANKKQHVAWFEDARSIDAKLRLAHEYRLGGVSYWTIGKYFPQNWLVMNSLFDVRKVL